jgi:hypothetical protein
MSDRGLSVSDRIILGASLGVSVAAIGLVAGGVAMFWGPFRQVLLAPVMIAIGVAAYVASRALWWMVKQHPARPIAR